MIGVLQRLIIKIIFKGDIVMMTMFFAQRVILGKTSFEDVPAALKKGCAEILIESDLPELVPEEFREKAE